IYPASFSATTNTGSIFIQNDITLWPSSTGTLTLSAGKDLIGVQQMVPVPDTSYGYIFIGYPNVPGGHWQLVKIADALKNPTLAGFVGTANSNVLSINGIAKPTDLPLKIVPTVVPSVTLLEQDPALFSHLILRNFNNSYRGRTTNEISQPTVPP